MIVYNQVVYLPVELYYLCIDFVFQFIVEKYKNKLNQIKSRYLEDQLNLGQWIVLSKGRFDVRPGPKRHAKTNEVKDHWTNTEPQHNRDVLILTERLPSLSRSCL